MGRVVKSSLLAGKTLTAAPFPLEFHILLCTFSQLSAALIIISRYKIVILYFPSTESYIG